MNKIHEILEKYWGYNSFRPLQQEIIQASLDGKDALALLPTGGGKSICFQVPALIKDGICIVISPLIALMKDQVENLTSKGIKAISISSSMHKREIDIALDNCIHSDIKFLYLSPERLETEIVKVRLQKMKVNLIAVDEAHCISQWGYDFRPSYLKISELRMLFPNVPVLALTATATSKVVNDIQEKLLFKKQNVFKKSFERKNLVYAVLYEENKLERLKKIILNVRGSGIVYVRNRKKTKEIANYLSANNISADNYHAGLDSVTRNQKQNNWIQNKTAVIVSTNAFGMGIDKPNVRFVVHFDLPDSMEEYFQEAGRAGRDEKKAYAVLFFNADDKINLLKNLDINFPELTQIKKIYNAIGNYYQLASGAGMGISKDFDISVFCDTYKLNAIEVFHCLKFLEREGYFALTDSYYKPSKIKIEINREDLYRFQMQNEKIDAFIKLLLRSYSGLFDDFISISESEISQKAKTSTENIFKRLIYLEKNSVITYVPKTDMPQILFTRPRESSQNFSLSKQNYEDLKMKAKLQIEAMLHYCEGAHICRSKLLLAYFDQKNVERCNQCDVCLEENNKRLTNNEFENIKKQIEALLALRKLTQQELVSEISDSGDEKIIHTIQLLLDVKILILQQNGNLILRKN